MLLHRRRVNDQRVRGQDRRWDLQAGKEIEEVRGFHGRWQYQGMVDGLSLLVEGQAAVGRSNRVRLPVGTGIMKTFQSHSQPVTCINISTDNS
jgi:hypothetical protein